jgi:hypothetical protein
MALKDIMQKAKGLIFEDVGDTLSTGTSSTGTGDLLKQLEASSQVTLGQMNSQMDGVSVSDVNVKVGAEALNPAAAASAPKPPAAPLVGANGDVSFEPIYQEAGLPSVPLTAEGFLEMVKEFGDIPVAAQRTMVGTMLNTMSKQTPGVSSASIANDALLKIQALSTYSEGVKKQLGTFVADREKSIADAELRIANEKKAIAAANERVQTLVTWCEDEGNVLDDVLEFFSTDTGNSKHAESTTLNV